MPPFEPTVLILLGTIVVLLLWNLFKTYGYSVSLNKTNDEAKITLIPPPYGPGPGMLEIPDTEEGKRFLDNMLKTRPPMDGEGMKPPVTGGQYL